MISLAVLRSRSNNAATLKVIFKEPLEAAWMERLSGVDKVNRITPNEWELVCKDVQEANKQLMELALQHNLNIVSLQSGEQSLEEVFRNLTSSSTKQ